ncbi:MAG: RHS repeat-associated core domain-containing protein, partial [Bacteroidales bacterium]|nr:RHS repeat-associated core domain-containing protein [Bacteroidales bacterium]
MNMNGRMYHPVLGRFLSPDPYVQAPEYSQNFNRYSYCLNNPLVFTDPSGEFWW